MPTRVTASGDFNHTAGLNAVRANLHFFRPAVVQSTDILKIRVETSLGYIMGMADIVANHRFFSTYFTYFGHNIVSCSSSFIKGVLSGPSLAPPNCKHYLYNISGVV